MSNQTVLRTDKKFFGHPFQLSFLFHIELWERFSYYGMQGILLIYLYYQASQGGLGIDKAQAGAIVGAYSGSVYLSTIFGGWLADRVLGAERTLFYSGIVVMFGHIALGVFPGFTGLLCGLVLVALGSGGVKSSASSMVGSLYESDDLRDLRDAGFSIFYIAVNIGAFLGPLLVGLLQENYGFHYGFGAAAVGMAFGLWRYSVGRKHIPPMPAPNPLQAGQGKRMLVGAVVALTVLTVAIAAGKLGKDNYSQVLQSVIIVAIFAYFAQMFVRVRHEPAKRNYLIAYVPMFAVMCVFWMLYFQIYTVITIYFDETVNRQIGSFTVPVSWKDSVSSLWVILFAGLLAALWTKMGKKQPKTPLKFVLSMLMMSVSFLVFIPFINSHTAMPLAVFALLSIGTVLAELLISPIALSFVTKIAPQGYQTQMVALHFLGLSVGMNSGGMLFKNFYDAQNAADFYCLVGVIGAVGGVVLLLFVPVLNRLLKGID